MHQLASNPVHDSFQRSRRYDAKYESDMLDYIDTGLRPRLDQEVDLDHRGRIDKSKATEVRAKAREAMAAMQRKALEWERAALLARVATLDALLITWPQAGNMQENQDVGGRGVVGRNSMDLDGIPNDDHSRQRRDGPEIFSASAPAAITGNAVEHKYASAKFKSTRCLRYEASNLSAAGLYSPAEPSPYVFMGTTGAKLQAEKTVKGFKFCNDGAQFEINTAASGFIAVNTCD